MITVCQMKNETFNRVLSVPGNTYANTKMKKKEIAKRTSSSPAKIISDRMELSKSSSHRNQSVRLPNAHPDDHPAASATTTASLDVTCDSSTTSQHLNVLYDTEQNVKLFKENPQSGMNEGRVPDNSSNSLSPISLVTDDHSDSSDKENHVVQGRHALKNLSRSTPAMSPSASPRHSDSEGQLRVSKGTKKFMRHFAEAPPSEWVLNYFSCALVSDILLQGTLYITHNYFAFYSKIFGHVSRLLIPVTQVASLQKERTAKIIPNAVGLQMLDGKNYVFGSLLSRDSTYKLMLHIWRKAQRMADSDSEPPSGVQVAAEDDGEDSVSGSANSLDQTDSGYLVSTAVNSLGSVPSPVTTTPWTTEEVTSTTNATTATNVYSTIDNSIPPTGNNIPMNSSTSTSDSTLLLGGGVVSGKVCAHEETNSNSATANSASDGKENSSMNILEWFTQGSLVKTCFKVGSVPMKLVGEGVKELWSLPRTSLLLLISTLLLLMLFASAAFMLHRVDLLSQQIGLEKYAEYDSMYEEVLQMQQRLHAAASTEIEKTLTIQLKHIATVRQSLEALMVLFNKDFPLEAAQIPDNT
ncbi:uncharacterized membrane protein C20F10.07-like isoform X9 [Portunus trituberculatus]|uniref:uncharacterized membrane protein C20F10.07-like isoform X9 n=1 Tax=Portunus trituberculatus TaxID=210409 RepID=UPI001E1D1DDA|nr:uncharacterized membrane protein C20F10.07-like isoform X9 [Portunus trituberculatus]